MELEQRLDKLESKVDAMDTQNTIFGESIKRFDNAICHLDQVLDGMQKTFFQLQQNSETNRRNIEKLEARVSAYDSNNNINLLNLLKVNIIPVILLIFLILQHLGIVK